MVKGTMVRERAGTGDRRREGKRKLKKGIETEKVEKE